MRVVTQHVDDSLVIGKLYQHNLISCVYTVRDNKLIPRCPAITVNKTMKQASDDLAFLYNSK